ncbi:LysR substrate-binding domain-containing protein [Niveispirillum sp. BGYR6]|uniref:LysR substrate-binding domain-containing protein n=1 Tax=Niveispirillum sp. BGYR6 TaxID=2971249 RepID=UPI0022B9840B|nr:LysR substrate-binding domain-containing protein [Niveispirillum sp. BGYR6]MDG5497468.1 LysR substrate-binding domain-containing protein [Niveispirillum sp. BGYR6]
MRQIEAFRAVMMSGGVTAAAAMLSISQPSVSRLIADLEHAVGFQLFDRRGSRMHPTKQAETLFEAVQRSFTGLDMLAQAARRIRAHPVGTVRLAVLPTFAITVLPPVLADFQALYPDVKVTVEVLGHRGVEDRLFLGQADLGIGVTAPPRDGIRTELLARAHYLCALPPAHRLTAQEVVRITDLAGERFIGPMHEADALWNGIDAALLAAGVEPVRMLECQQSMPMYAYVAAGLGLSIVEPFSARLYRRLGVVTRPVAPVISLDFTFLEPDIGPTPPPIQWLRDAIRREAAAAMLET